MNTSSAAPTKLRVPPWLRLLWIASLPVDLMDAVGAILYASLGVAMLNGGTPDALIPLPALDTGPLVLIPVLCVIVPGVGFALLMLYASMALIGAMRYCTVTIKPDGLEVNQWPHFHVFCDWAGMERETSLVFLGLPTIRLVGAQPLPDTHFARWFRLLAIRQQYNRLSLWWYEGYPHGPLGDALRRNAPHLFPPVPGP